ncbi:hypothetical protein, partial [Bradyrhizobium iriomotense]|uniref:hypothetical protein n=1 Tax=Bradyrhizobium iriomotense TaxID=441950 RepID=UPI001B89FAC3
PDRIVRPDIVLNPRRQKTGLLPALAGFAIRRILHQLPKSNILAQPRRAKQEHDGIMAALGIGGPSPA